MGNFQTRYQGRWWDAPMTDDAILDPEYFVGKACDMCREPIGPNDDAVALPYLCAHLECQLRSGMGDVQHLEKRCLCYLGAGEVTYDSDHHTTAREDAHATLVWLLAHGQGRFRAS